MFRRSFSGHQRGTRSFNRPRPRGQFGRQGVRSSISHAQYVNKAVTQFSEEDVLIRHKFTDFHLDSQLEKNVLSHGYSTPTPIQDQTIGHILEGRDVIGIANTGTGKTAAFLLPLINKIIHARYEKVLIVVPTRELAVQIGDEVRAFCQGLNIYSLLFIGGASIHRQIYDLRRGPSIMVGTPGRLKDLVQRRILDLSKFGNIVLDEVDRMVDIGFIQDIKFLISFLPRERQSLFFSATIPPEVNSIIQSFLRNPVTVSVKVKETAKGIDQYIIRVNGKEEKVHLLRNLLKEEPFKKVLIFGRTKWGVERLSKSLQQSGFRAGSIHGNKSQHQRLSVLAQFKNNQLSILVATDVAARGLDIEDVSHVINFDEPASYTDYIHRIGRTGRANKLGKALTFVG